MIKKKTAICLDCDSGKEVPVIAGRCKHHYWIHRSLVKSGKPKRKPISPVSRKMTQRLAEYRRKRDRFLRENPVCMFPGCGSREVSCHHSRGRTGDLLTDERWFKSLCVRHHEHVERNPEEAKKLKLSYSRLEKLA